MKTPAQEKAKLQRERMRQQQQHRAPAARHSRRHHAKRDVEARKTASHAQKVTVDIIIEKPSFAHKIVQQLKALGATKVSSAYALVAADVPTSKLVQVSKLAGVTHVRKAYKPIKHAGSVQSQGVKATRSDIANAFFGVTGYEKNEKL